jgi:hypothetical protein
LSNSSQSSPRSRRDLRKRKPVGRKGQALLEIHDDAFSDNAIQALVDDWIVPMIVDHIIESTVASSTNVTPSLFRGNYEYNNFGGTANDERQSKGWTATETSSTATNAETATDADGVGAQRAEQVRGTAEHDDE